MPHRRDVIDGEALYVRDKEHSLKKRMGCRIIQLVTLMEYNKNAKTVNDVLNEILNQTQYYKVVFCKQRILNKTKY